MALDLQLANGTVNEQADALARRLDAGIFRLYAGAKPATADTALTGQTLLAELVIGNPSAPAASAGILTFNAVNADPSANADGTASFFRAFKADGTTVVMDGTAGDDSGTFDAEINDPDIQAGTEVVMVSWTHTVPKA